MDNQLNENNSNLSGCENKDKLLKLNFQNIKNRHPNVINIRNINKNKVKRPISSYNHSINKKLYNSLNDENNKLKIHTKLGENSFLNLKGNIYFNAFKNNSNLLKQVDFNNKDKEESKNFRDYFSDKEKDSSNLFHNKIENNNNAMILENRNIKNYIKNLRYSKNQRHFFSSFEKINSIKNKNIILNRKYSSLSTKNITKQRTTFDNQDKIECKSSRNINKRNFPLYKEREIKSSDNLISSNNLIEYKEVVCNSPEIPFNINYYKKKNYNNLIRIRNKQKISNDKRYSFYKYKEYMDKIENEKIEIYKKDKEKRKKVNIQKIFQEMPTHNKKNQKISQNEIKNKENLELNYDIKNKINNDINLLNNDSDNNLKDDDHQSDVKTDKKIEEDKIIIKKNPKKNKINHNKKYISDLKKNLKAISHTHKKKKNKNIEKEEYESSYSESNITINYFFDSKINFPKIGKKDMSSVQKPLNFNKIQKYEKNLFNPEELLIPSEIKNELNINDDDFNIEMLSDKDLKDKIGDREVYELLKKKYFKNKERMMLMNKRNIKAQKILFKKIIESDKDQKSKRPSQLEPFFNLKFKYTDEEINLYKQKFLSKYYEKNKNNFTPVRNKESFNSNNSINISKQYNSPSSKNIKNIEENNEIIIKEKSNTEDKVDNDKEDDDKISNNKIGEDIIKNHTDNSIQIKKDENNGSIFFDREINNLKKNKKNKNKNIIKEKGYLKNFFEKYFKNWKKENEGGNVKEEIQEKLIKEVNHKFSKLIHENEDIIGSSSRKEEAELFLEFKEKMISLARYSKKEYNLYLVKNYKYIVKVLEECKRDKEREERIDKFLKSLNEDLRMNSMFKSDLWQDIKVIDYQPFISINKNKK